MGGYRTKEGDESFPWANGAQNLATAGPSLPRAALAFLRVRVSAIAQTLLFSQLMVLLQVK